MAEDTPDLVTFLRARCDEDEQNAQVQTEGPWIVPAYDPTRVKPYGSDGLIARAATPETAAHIARHDPARVLAEVVAKRRIVDEHSVWVLQSNQGPRVNMAHFDEPDMQLACRGCNFGNDEEPLYGVDECPTKRLLALPYADHPDYRQEWRP